MGWLIFIVVTGVVVYWYVADEQHKKKQKFEELSRTKYRYANNEFQYYEEKFPSPYNRKRGLSWNDNLIDLFSIDEMEQKLSEMIQVNEKLRNEIGVYFNQCNFNIEINHYLDIIKYSKVLRNNLENTPRSQMIDSVKYGRINNEYWELVNSMDREYALSIIRDCNMAIETLNMPKICDINLEELIKTLWFFAITKPFSVSDFREVCRIIRRLNSWYFIDVTIAELYVKKTIGGEEAIDKYIKDILKEHTFHNQGHVVASALMWLNAYRSEYLLLQKMLEDDMELPENIQRRLRALSNGAGCSAEYNVKSSDQVIYFDITSVAWKDNEYNGLFENLAFQEKSLTYSLTIREETKDLSIDNIINLISPSTIFSKLKSVFEMEYGNTVSINLTDGIALSGDYKERLEGILMKPRECEYMNVYVHIARIGKKLNIKFYTLFTPCEDSVDIQKQQVYVLYEKLSPLVVTWENSIKESALLAIQQFLNERTQIAFSEETQVQNVDTPIF